MDKYTDTQESDVKILTEKELLEEFLNSLESDDTNFTDIESITAEMRLNKFLYVINLKEQELKKCESIARESIQRTNDWLESKQKKVNSTIEYLSNQMKNYLQTEKLKSLSLPNGIIGLRKQPDTIEIIDEELFMSKANPQFIKHLPETYTPDMKAIKDHMKSTGELPEGAELRSKSEKFYYRLDIS